MGVNWAPVPGAGAQPGYNQLPAAVQPNGVYQPDQYRPSANVGNAFQQMGNNVSGLFGNLWNTIKNMFAGNQQPVAPGPAPAQVPFGYQQPAPVGYQPQNGNIFDSLKQIFAGLVQSFKNVVASFTGNAAPVNNGPWPAAVPGAQPA
ncbi:MAG: hypothetical protein JWM80_6222, partial [Cyanobacteria bacterium RYN_339]|nr:hypothetical protein [Cyanobacteria bacterium RYN_339]